MSYTTFEWASLALVGCWSLSWYKGLFWQIFNLIRIGKVPHRKKHECYSNCTRNPNHKHISKSLCCHIAFCNCSVGVGVFVTGWVRPTLYIGIPDWPNPGRYMSMNQLDISLFLENMLRALNIWLTIRQVYMKRMSTAITYYSYRNSKNILNCCHTCHWSIRQRLGTDLGHLVGAATYMLS